MSSKISISISNGHLSLCLWKFLSRAKASKKNSPSLISRRVWRRPKMSEPEPLSLRRVRRRSLQFDNLMYEIRAKRESSGSDQDFVAAGVRKKEGRKSPFSLGASQKRPTRGREALGNILSRHHGAREASPENGSWHHGAIYWYIISRTRGYLHWTCRACCWHWQILTLNCARRDGCTSLRSSPRAYRSRVSC